MAKGSYFSTGSLTTHENVQINWGDFITSTQFALSFLVIKTNVSESNHDKLYKIKNQNRDVVSCKIRTDANPFQKNAWGCDLPITLVTLWNVPGALRGPKGTVRLMFLFFTLSPAIVANLWDVTDKDIDRFSESLLKQWLDPDTYLSLPEVLSQSRRACKLKYLIGASPVLYGFPVHIKT